VPFLRFPAADLVIMRGWEFGTASSISQYGAKP
jgi:hypothetical protein